MAEAIETPLRHFATLISDIKKGTIRIPDFQRAYVWQLDQVLDLLDSVQKGYPIGSILLWETTDKLSEHDPLELNLPELSIGHTRQYLLDGQQRLVTLYAIVHNTLELGKKRKIKYQVFYDLKKEKFEIYKKKDVDAKKELPKIEDWFVSMNEVIQIDYNTKSMSPNNELITKYASKAEFVVAYTNLFTRFNSLQIPAITTGQKLPIACKIFERLNNTATPLTIVDLMVATTYTKKFNLRDSLEAVNLELDSLDFDLSERTMLQCMSSCFESGTTRDHIINSSSKIEDNWKKTIQSLKLSIDFLKQHCSVPVSRFLPNEIILAPLTYFFYKHGNKQLSPDNIKQLKKYFWLSVLSQRYNQSQDSKVEEAINNMDKLLESPENNLFDYYFQKIDAQTIKNTEMSFGSAFAKGILCFLASKHPLEFENNTVVRLDLSFADANLKQLHHIFPKNFVKTQTKLDDKERDYINSIANISLISQTTNRKIWDTKPSLYFASFAKNKILDKSLKSHLIEDLNSFGLKNDDFKIFIDKRSKAIADSIEEFVKTLQ